MSLSSVKMAEEVWLTCLTHALTTETEEIMGLLLGDIQLSDNGYATALIWGASPQMRSDRRKDRVETKPELLAAASAQADHRMTVTTGRTTRVIGWYHSHPHITVLPSHVDVRTQAMYQLLDNGFIGLIFSCFSEDALKVGRIQVIAFQSTDGKQKQAPLLMNTSIIEVESSSSSGSIFSSSTSTLSRSSEHDTGDSRASKATKVGGRSSGLGELFSHADADYVGKQRTRENALVVYNEGNVHNATAESESSDMTPSMQEALHRSNMDISGAEYLRKEVPLEVLPARYMLKLDSPLSSFTDLQRVLFEEERSAYKQAISQNMRDGRMHPLNFVHHTSTYQASLCKLMEYCLYPAISALQDHLKENELRLAMLMEEAQSLETDSRGRKSAMDCDSPRRHGVHGSSVAGPSSIGSRRKAS